MAQAEASENTTPRDLAFLSLHPFVCAAVHDKILGTIIGGAVGDSIGLYTEFLSRPTVEKAYPDARFALTDPITPFYGDTHRDKFEPVCSVFSSFRFVPNSDTDASSPNQGNWTDDTDHALLIILSYLHHNGRLDLQDFAQRLRKWCSQGLRCLDRLPLGLGRTVGGVVLDPSYLSSPPSTALKHWHMSSRTSAANGSLMRTHPLGLVALGLSLDETFRLAADVSRLTHPDPRCVVACCAVTGLIRGLVRGEIVDEEGVDVLLERAFTWVEVRVGELTDPAPAPAGSSPEPGSPPTSTLPAEPASRSAPLLSRAEYTAHTSRSTSLSSLSLSEAGKIGYVYKCLGAAIFSLRQAIQLAPFPSSSSSSSSPSSSTATAATTVPGPRVFEDLITHLTMQAGDADTNCAVAGALVGGWLGGRGLPGGWVEGLKEGEWLRGKAEGLARVVMGEEERIGQDPDTAEDGGKGWLDEKELERREIGLYERMAAVQSARREMLKKEEERERGGKGVKKWARSLGGFHR